MGKILDILGPNSVQFSSTDAAAIEPRIKGINALLF